MRLLHQGSVRRRSPPDGSADEEGEPAIRIGPRQANSLRAHRTASGTGALPPIETDGRRAETLTH